MNRTRRTALAKALPLIVQAQALLAEARAIVAGVRDEEDDVYQGMSEGQQNGDLGESMQAAITDMDEAVDGIDGLDLKDVAEAIGRAADQTADVAGATLGEEEVLRRRMARLPSWAKDELSRAERRAQDADARLRDVFGDVDEKRKDQIVIDDYSSPIRGKVIPSTQIVLPAYNIRIQADRSGRGVEIQALDMGVINVIPQASNTVIVRNSPHF